MKPRLNLIIFTLVVLVTVIQGCNPFESIFDKQVKACVADVKLGLSDPSSLEVISTEGVEIDNGSFRVKLNFTAKNAMGGRVRGYENCGFKDKNAIVLNSDDFQNQQRDTARTFKALGIPSTK
jgi:hypothetical protein